MHNNSVDEVHETLMHYYTQIFNGVCISLFHQPKFDEKSTQHFGHNDTDFVTGI